MKVAVLIPVYNDWPSLRILLARLTACEIGGGPVEVFVVDDSSTVSPEDWLPADMGSGLARVTKISLARNLGHQGAIAVGMSHVAAESDCDCVVIMDADGEDRPEDIQLLLSAYERGEGKAIVFARRQDRQETASFKALYKAFKAFHLFLTGQVMDIGNFSVAPIGHVAGLTSFPELWSHYPATVLKSKMPVIKQPCDRGARIDGQSQMSLTSLILHGLASVSVFAPIVGARMLIVTACMMGVFLVGMFSVAGIRVFTEMAIPGWATYATGLLGILFLQLLSLALFFVFLILNKSNPSQALPKHTSPLFIKDVTIAWDSHGDA